MRQKMRIAMLILPVLAMVLFMNGCLTGIRAGEPSSGEGTVPGKESAAAEADMFMDFWESLFITRREMVVGKNISPEDITEFYYTYDSSAYPPDYQRYRFYTEDGTGMFYHETREGDHWPLMEEDVTVSGTKELTEEEWEEFCSYLEGGHVRKREESLEDGDAGPWLYLYWKRDQSVYQEFSFASPEAQTSFEEFCQSLKDAEQAD